ncbi:hypothetical protein TrRE_jg6723 [Triparma retinervis]|uniref:Uncharacterized protein n=1 Tax=Triparma retinervis TaxID=2557542 RepID=A0A9W6ZBL5_9STRA|nr:hypothetical protein TrRE_jg6723 [Triparma retinervis]
MLPIIHLNSSPGTAKSPPPVQGGARAGPSARAHAGPSSGPSTYSGPSPSAHAGPSPSAHAGPSSGPSSGPSARAGPRARFAYFLWKSTRTIR